MIETDAGLVGFECAPFYTADRCSPSCAAAAAWTCWASATCTATARCGSCRTGAGAAAGARRRRATTCSGPRRSASPGPPTTCRELAPGLTLHRTGGHFPGHSVLHDERRGVLFCGDCSRSTSDAATATPGRAVAPQGVPRADPAVARRAARVPRGGRRLEFDAVATPFELAPRRDDRRTSSDLVRPAARRAADAGPIAAGGAVTTTSQRYLDSFPPGGSRSSPVDGLDVLDVPLHSAVLSAVARAPRRQRPRLRRHPRGGAHRRAR